MSEPMDLERLKALCEKATEGPWSTSWKNDHGAGLTGPTCARLGMLGGNYGIVTRLNAIRQSPDPAHWYGEVIARTIEHADADFIAAAREAMPQLIQRLLDLEGRLARAEKVVESARHVKERCEAGFKELGMEGPDRLRMGAIWFDSYIECRDAVAAYAAAPPPPTPPTTPLALRARASRTSASSVWRRCSA